MLVSPDFFSAHAKPGYRLQDLSNVRGVRLICGIHGFFRAVNCGGSCAPAYLWWEENGVLYQIQLELSPALSAQSQRAVMEKIADSAILAGPR